MASFICHVVGGTKRVRVERTVRQQSSPHDDRRSSHAVCARRSRRGVLPGMTPQRREKEVSHGCCSSTLRLAATLRAPILWPLTPPLPDCLPGPTMSCIRKRPCRRQQTNQYPNLKSSSFSAASTENGK